MPVPTGPAPCSPVIESGLLSGLSSGSALELTTGEFAALGDREALSPFNKQRLSRVKLGLQVSDGVIQVSLSRHDPGRF